MKREKNVVYADLARQVKHLVEEIYMKSKISFFVKGIEKKRNVKDTVKKKVKLQIHKIIPNEGDLTLIIKSYLV